ncbi:helix-turn-helix domain-containing protein [Bradyrhizobium yuanmingense]|uniref:helix-turn-helix domain-containing protein n=1 Tax=Bradyrhizobium yuanmingense TaxID=108015 RepID=UPI0023B9D9BE|nr:helix-turn-helix transcriptional regulator [Bradyrhizobium yuanmingense]MDF0584176.1 helix-turn-helix transcriptional regulator [Bradyrhizobium yuanmingense]
MSLSKMLKDIRATNGASLRAVEDATGISNAYLSQLERGDAQKPSPDKLQALAKFYNVPYVDLMRAAGYLQRTERTSNTTHDRVSTVQAALMSANLTPEEEDAVVKYIEFLRFQNKK